MTVGIGETLLVVVVLNTSGIVANARIGSTMLAILPSVARFSDDGGVCMAGVVD